MTTAADITAPIYRPAAASPGRPVVLHVLHTLNRAGAELLVRDLVADLRDRYRFVVAALDTDGPLHEDLRDLGAEVRLLNRRSGFDFGCARRIARLVREDQVDLIHAHQYTPFCYAAMARLAGGHSAKLIFTEHGRHYPDERRPRRVWANRLLLGRLAHRITAVGPFVRRALASNEGLSRHRIEVIRNGVRTDHFVPNPETRRRVRDELNLSDRQPVIGQVGGFRPVKDHRTAIHALRHLHLLGCPAMLLLVGEGPCLELTRAEAVICRVDSHVRFLGRREDVADLWRAADVAMLTSLSEGTSVALLEAMACGLPVVATDVGGNREVVEHETTGLLGPRGDAPALAAHLQRLFADAHLRQRCGEAGRRRVIEQFNKTDMHREYARLYEELTHALAPAAAGIR